MSWILLLIQLLPSLLKLIQMVRDAIARQDDPDRRLVLRREMRFMARRHARELAAEHETALNGAHDKVREVRAAIEKEWQTFHDEIA